MIVSGTGKATSKLVTVVTVTVVYLQLEVKPNGARSCLPQARGVLSMILCLGLQQVYTFFKKKTEPHWDEQST
jgi:hypothetical protein